MQSYRPAEKSVASKLLRNPFFHISIIFILVCAGSLHILREQKRQEIARRVDYLKSGPIFAESVPPTSATDVPAEASVSAEAFEPPVTAESATPTDEASTAPSADATAVAGTGPEVTASPRDLAASETATDTAKAPAQLKVTYALVPRAALFRMAEAGRAQGGKYVDFGEFQMGSLRNIASFLTGVDVVDSVQKKFAAALGEQVWFSGEKTPQGDIGITTKMTLRGRDEGDVQGDIELMRSLHELPGPGTPIAQKGYGPADFEVQTGQGLYVILVLPRVPQYDERNMTPTKFLRIYRMSDFKQKQSEFVMFMEFD